MNHIKITNLVTLAGKVKGYSGYEHGDASIQKVLIGMARSYDGYCYIPLLFMKSAGFGSRNQSNEESCARYLDYVPSNIIKLLFPIEDIAFLEKDEYDVPFTYCSTLPLIILNYNKQPASGWSVDIMPRDFNHVCDIVLKMIKGNFKNEYVIPANDYTPLRTYSVVDNAEYFSGCYEIKNNKSFVIKEIPPFRYIDNITSKLEENKDIFTKVINLSGGYDKVNVTGEILDLSKAIKKIEQCLVVKYTSQLNIVINSKNARVKEFDTFYKIIHEWFIQRKQLFESIYCRNKMILELEIAREKDIRKFMFELPDNKILLNYDKLIKYLIINNYKKISNKTFINRYNYTNKDKLQDDWYNFDDASYDYITQKKIIDISHIKQSNNLNKLENEHEELLRDNCPFPYANRWRLLIKCLRDAYNKNVKNNWLEEDRE